MRKSLARMFLDAFFDLFPDEQPLIPVLDLKLAGQSSHVMSRRAARTVLLNFLSALADVLQQSSQDKLPAKPLFCTQEFYALRLRTAKAEGKTAAEDKLLGEIEKIRAMLAKNQADKMPPGLRYATLRSNVTALLGMLKETAVEVTPAQHAAFHPLEEKAERTDTQTIAAFGEKMLVCLVTLEAKTDGALLAKTDTVGAAPLADFYGYEFVDELKKAAGQICPLPPQDVSRCLVM